MTHLAFSSSESLQTTAQAVARAVGGLDFQERDSSFRAGVYFLCRRLDGRELREEVIVQRNLDPEDPYFDVEDETIVLVDTSRPDEFVDALRDRPFCRIERHEWRSRPS